MSKFRQFSDLHVREMMFAVGNSVCVFLIALGYIMIFFFVHGWHPFSFL